jgi:hypothetical protein
MHALEVLGKIPVISYGIASALESRPDLGPVHYRTIAHTPRVSIYSPAERGAGEPFGRPGVQHLGGSH